MEDKNPKNKKITAPRLIMTNILISLVFLGVLFMTDGIAWGVKIANIKAGNKDNYEIQGILEKEWNDFSEQNITFRCSDLDIGRTYCDKLTNLSTNLKKLGFKIDLSKTIEQASQIGHRGSQFNKIQQRILALFGKYKLSIVYDLDQERFKEQTAELFKDIEQPAQNATLIFNNESNEFLLEHSVRGIAMDKERLLVEISKNITAFSIQPVVAILTTDRPLVSNNEVESAKQQAEKILSKQPYYLTFEWDSWTIKKATLINWIKFEPIKEENSENYILGVAFDEDKIKEFLSGIAESIDRPAANAQLETQENRAIVFEPEQTGIKLSDDETINQIKENLLSDPPIEKTAVVAKKAYPKITLAKTNQLGIKELIGQGISNFSGSPKNRIHNIKTGVSKFNGLILKPDEEFSFNTLLGGSEAEQGFLPELVIKKEELVAEYGGGLCQISTTLFRAAVNAGLKITQRRPHAFPVVYYNPQGFDATVYDPWPDMRFINDTGAHLLIEGIVQGRQLTFNFYSTDDGRQTKVTGPTILEKNEDGSMKTSLKQEVYKDGELLREDTFYSNYDSPDKYAKAEDKKVAEAE